jgi:tetratricopeptide (TPR) repeat protein
LNTIAYELAENRMRLDDALQYAQKAVTKIEHDTAAISLDNLLQQDLRTTPKLAAYWDTLGWVHFKTGHLDLAEKYVNAAWSITQSAVMADHLGQIYQNEGKTHDAAVAYARALSTSGEVPEDTRGRLRSLRPGGTLQRGESPDAGALQDLRSTTLRKLANGHATAEFFLLFKGDSKSVDVKFISGSDALQDAAKVLASTNFNVLFPDDSSARILRRGLLDCEPEADKCMFVLIPPEMVRSLH